MKELYRGFKKVSENDNSATLQHENGHELTIAKSGLNKATLKMLKELPLHQANGTQPEVDQSIEDLQKEMEASKAGKAPAEEPTFSGEKYKPEGEQLKSEVSAQPDITSPEFRALAESWGGAENIPQNVIEDLKQRGAPGFGSASVKGAEEAAKIQGLQQEMQQVGIGAPPPPSQPEALAQPEKPRTLTGQPQAIAPKAPAKPKSPQEILSDPNSSVSDKYAAHLQMADDYNKQMAAEDARFEEAMKTDQIKPQTIYGNKDFGQKVSTFIGLLLGGLGAGLTGGENVVQKMLDKQIEMDVEEQKRQSEKKTNLYKIHLERLGNRRDAEIATANNLKQVALMKMEEAAGLYGGNKAAQERIQNQILTTRFGLEQSRAGLAQLKAQRDATELAKKTGTQVSDQFDPRIEKSVKVLIPGQPGLRKMYATSPQEVPKLREKASALASVRKTLDNLGRIYAESSSSLTGLSGKRREDAVAELAQAKLDLLKAQDLSPKLAEELDAILGSAGALESFKPGFTGKAEERRRRALTIVNQLSNNLIEGNLTN